MELWNAPRHSLRSCPRRDLVGSTAAERHPLGGSSTPVTTPEILKSHGLEVVYGSDVQRAGAFVELRMEGVDGVAILAELFSPEVGEDYTFWMEAKLPLQVVQAFLEYARNRLAEPGKWPA